MKNNAYPLKPTALLTQNDCAALFFSLRNLVFSQSQ